MPRPANPELIEKIKRIVAEEVKKKGIDGLSVRNIAKRAGVTPTTIYYYFESKEDLINAVKLSAVKEMDAYILSRVQPEAPPLQQAEDLIRAFIDWALKYPPLMDLAFSALPPKLDLDEAALKVYYRSQFLAFELLEKIVAENAGPAETSNPKVDCSIYLGMIYGTVKLYLEKRTFPDFWADPSPLFERLVEMIRAALSK